MAAPEEGNQHIEATVTVRLVIQHLFDRTMLYNVPILATASRGDVMSIILRTHDDHVPKFVRFVELFYVKDVVAVVDITALECSEPTEAAVLGPVAISDELTTAMKQPHLFTVARDGSFRDHHPSVLTNASPLKALCLTGELRRKSVAVTIILGVVLALAIGTAAGGPAVGFGCAVTDSPPDGPIKLGNVITSVKWPHRPRFCLPPPNDSDVFKTSKRTVQFTKEKLRGGKFSILTKFLSVLGFGVDFGLGIERSDGETFTFETLETCEFIPTPAYLQTCIQDEAVQRYLQTSRYKPIYIITGLKVVTGAQANTHKSRATEGTLDVEVDGTVWSGGAVPIGGGPGVEGKVEKKSSTGWEGSSDFVFAFRVSKVLVQKKDGQVKSEEEYQKGAMLGLKTEVISGPGMEVMAVQEPSAESEGWDGEVVMDDEGAVAVAVPNDDDDSDD